MTTRWQQPKLVPKTSRVSCDRWASLIYRSFTVFQERVAEGDRVQHRRRADHDRGVRFTSTLLSILTLLKPRIWPSPDAPATFRHERETYRRRARRCPTS
jgi:hypothetical protein